jgi:hypothetical protein
MVFFYPTKEETPMHPKTLQFQQKLEREAALMGSHRKILGKSELAFLEEVWLPAMNGDTEGLHAEYPLKDFKGGQRFIDFVYTKNRIRLIIEIDGFTTHVRDISVAEYDDHLTRQNDLILAGWLVMRFSANLVERKPQICQRQLKQAIGHWWAITRMVMSSDDVDLWELREQRVVQMAIESGGSIRPAQLAEAFRISNSTAAAWMRKFTDRGVFTPIIVQKRITKYKLTHWGPQ